MSVIFKVLLLFFFFISCQTITGIDSSIETFHGQIQLKQSNEKIAYPIDIYIDKTLPQMRADILGGFRGIVATFLWSTPNDFKIIFPTEKSYIESSDASELQLNKLDLFIKNLPSIYQALNHQAPDGWKCQFKPFIKKVDLSLNSPKTLQTISLPKKCQLNNFKIRWYQKLAQLISLNLSLKQNKSHVTLNLKRKKPKQKSSNHFQIDIPSSFKKITKIDQI